MRLGGAPLEVPGLGGQFYQPTVVAGVTPDMAIAREEVFGPVLSVLTFKTLDEAIEPRQRRLLWPFGRGLERECPYLPGFARRAQAGTVWTNSWMDGFAELPFGGVKESGQGRELGRYGLEEFLEVKTVQMRIGRTRAPWVTTR